ncbi:molybdopterin molybdotransferase MoeA [uncultured Eudoraea sp.]|uniref:molybdopterin molybdotransferase MoeA n=1 Tax=uncultured Eudoraea sp. TaxID=1035614 RepID=UPI0026373822|nr:molybdopterin molybdotransferase MoeA [uncultured Eudoraea sp.]
MIAFSDAYNLVLSYSQNYGEENVSLKKAVGRVLAEDIHADRDFPPFDRATKDGIAINYDAIENGRKSFNIKAVIAAGQKTYPFLEQENCVEIMTGAVVPIEADTVVMYEDIGVEHEIATINTLAKRGQNIHYKGSDQKKGELVLNKDTRITAAEIGVLASVGKATVKVKKLPGIAVISTGNELVEVEEHPLPHQIRKSNSYTLYAALQKENIEPLLLHLSDDKDMIRQKLSYVIQEMDVVLMSGGVSKGKFDFIPKVLGELGVKNVFHGVLQRPGKPFWFGMHEDSNTVIFSFPGNPISTFANYYIYFKPWLLHSLGLPLPEVEVSLEEPISIKGSLTRFLGVKTRWENGILKARFVKDNGSGDLTSLARSDGFIKLIPREQPYNTDEKVSFISTRTLV